MLYSLTPYSFLSEGVQAIFYYKGRRMHVKIRSGDETKDGYDTSTTLKMCEYSSCDDTH